MFWPLFSRFVYRHLYQKAKIQDIKRIKAGISTYGVCGFLQISLKQFRNVVSFRLPFPWQRSLQCCYLPGSSSHEQIKAFNGAVTNLCLWTNRGTRIDGRVTDRVRISRWTLQLTPTICITNGTLRLSSSKPPWVQSQYLPTAMQEKLTF